MEYLKLHNLTLGMNFGYKNSKNLNINKYYNKNLYKCEDQLSGGPLTEDFQMPFFIPGEPLENTPQQIWYEQYTSTQNMSQQSIRVSFEILGKQGMQVRPQLMRINKCYDTIESIKQRLFEIYQFTSDVVIH